MAYTPDPTNPNTPTVADLAGNMALELQSLKGYIQSLVAGGSNFYNLGSYRNRLNNGAFNISQRGSSVTIASGTGGYTLDQWICATVGGDVVAAKSPNSPIANNYAITLSPQTGLTTLNFANRIESANCQDLIAGTYITVSGMFFATGPLVLIPSISLSTPNVVDTWSSSSSASIIQGMGTQVILPGQWLPFKNTFQLTADCTKGLAVTFGVFAPSGDLSGYSFSYARMQLEKSNVATAFEVLPVGVDLIRCQRYYQNLVVHSKGYGITSAAIEYMIPFLVSVFNNGTVTPNFVSLANLTAAAVTASTVNECLFSATITTSGGYIVDGTVTISCEL